MPSEAAAMPPADTNSHLNLAKPLCAGRRGLERRDAEPGGKVPVRTKGLGDGKRPTFSEHEPGSPEPVALLNHRPRGIDVGHQLMSLLVAPIRMVTLGERKVGDREFLGGDRPNVDPKPLEECECVVEEQLCLARGS